jgi:hypothetical protein
MKKSLIILTISLLTINCSTLGPSTQSSPSSNEKKSNSIFPEGKESLTLLSATISPDTITTKGSVVTVYFKNNDPISTANLIPVVVFVVNTMTITSRTIGDNLIKDDNYFLVNVSNPSITNPYSYSYGKGQLSGSGTIYVYLEEKSDGSNGEDVKRVSNILSVYATFK